MVLKPHIENHELDQMLDWYRANFEHVRVVRCGNRKCGAVLALEVSGGTGVPLDRRGVAVLPIGDKLLASRVRLDENEHGEPMMGYQCICGNDTRLSTVEKENPPA